MSTHPAPPVDWTRLDVPTPDGRTLEVLLHGPDDALPLVFHHGTPQAAWPTASMAAAVDAAGLRVVLVSRPGYGTSTPRAAAARIVDDVTDTVTVLDHLGLDAFVTAGWSGGGPRSLACAALLPGRCVAAVSGVGVAPYVGFEDDFLAGMGEENVEEFGAALAGEGPLRALLEQWRPQFTGMTADTVVEAMGDLLPDVDRAFLTDEAAEENAATFRHALLRGVEGWLHDDLAFVAPWGFEPEDVRAPVAIWQGRQDRMVPLAHAELLARRVPGAEVHLSDVDGHLSLLARLPEILLDLRRLAGR
ncbi:alpha/beta hydrolase [Nocardioides sp. TRM66260-LWL]|uniref:alpha/beta fold hydrolase n=1 Tax=Nocardioides sp. TRM66260-LWL TaxID=2874478 RepID=UPI001CC7DA68|nr:alpha/beta hydrolase [Nocardioides sp. TRM66260-LWL]MBZ5733902.1 alpha/beta hydrolase [Nocardioides sp. TRM66260-LWL]